MSMTIRPPAELPTYPGTKTVSGSLVIGSGITVSSGPITVTNGVQVGIQNTSTVASSPTAGAAMQVTSNDGAAMASGDRLGGYFIAGATDGSGSIVSSAALVAFAAEAWSGSAAGTSIQLQTVTAGSTSRTAKLTIDGNGHTNISGGLTVGTATGAATGSILAKSSSSTAAVQIDAVNNGGAHASITSYGSAYVGNNVFGVAGASTSEIFGSNALYVGTSGNVALHFGTNATLRGNISASGTWTISTGLNIGTATGAGTGAIRSSSSYTVLSLPTTGNYTSDGGYNGILGSFSGSVTAGNSLNIDGYGSLVFIMLKDSGGHCSIVSLTGASNVVHLQGFSSSAFNVNSDAGTVWAVFHNGTNYVIKNRTGSTRSFSAIVLG